MSSSELFRLSPDEAAIVQLYRLLDEDYKVALTSMATNLVETTSLKTKNNVYPLARILKTG